MTQMLSVELQENANKKKNLIDQLNSQQKTLEIQLQAIEKQKNREEQDLCNQKIEKKHNLLKQKTLEEQIEKMQNKKQEIEVEKCEIVNQIKKV